MTLSNAELEAIEARAQKATPGPWRLCTRAIISDDTVMTTIASCEQSARSTVEQQEYDADFIAAARSDIPALLTALRERDAEITGLIERAEAAERGCAHRDELLKGEFNVHFNAGFDLGVEQTSSKIAGLRERFSEVSIELAARALFTKHWQRPPDKRDLENGMLSYRQIAHDVAAALSDFWGLTLD